MAFAADTLFSALCHEAITLGGQDLLEKLYRLAKEDELLFSDSMPYCGEALYIPRPVAPAKSKAEGDPGLRKKNKKMSYLPVSLMDQYLAFLRGETGFEVSLDVDGGDAESTSAPPAIRTKFGMTSTSAKVSIKGHKETEPFHVGTFSFFSNSEQDACGLYVIIGYNRDSSLELALRLLKSLGATGIGGKTSAGYGKFAITDEIFIDDRCDEQMECLKKHLHSQAPNRYMLMSLALPKEEEIAEAIEGSTYALERRGGFVQSASYGNAFFKKKTGYMFSAGSVFKMPFTGDVYDVSVKGAHPVYRYGKAMFLGVDL